MHKSERSLGAFFRGHPKHSYLQRERFRELLLGIQIVVRK
jgi:hypothetical protein